MNAAFGAIIFLLITGAVCGEKCDKRHGCVKMGARAGCDDGKTNIGVDWDKKDASLYSCLSKQLLPHKKVKPVLKENMKEHMPLHICVNQSIVYRRRLPTSGRHRPVWPQYGEYFYLPPQRWLHNMEHGAAVFLYHPCAEAAAVQLFLAIGRRCLNRRVTTPYKKLLKNRPFAVLTWRNSLELSTVDESRIVDFVKKHALNGPEHTSRNGQYKEGVILPAPVGGDSREKLCSRIY